MNICSGFFSWNNSTVLYVDCWGSRGVGGGEGYGRQRNGFVGLSWTSAGILSLHWRHNDHDGISNHQPYGCLLNRLFRRRSKKTSKLRVTGLCVGNSPGSVNSPHKGPVTRKMFPFDDVIMIIDCRERQVCAIRLGAYNNLQIHNQLEDWDFTNILEKMLLKLTSIILSWYRRWVHYFLENEICLIQRHTFSSQLQNCNMGF